MVTIIEVILEAGRSAIELALFTLLPIMVVTMVLLRVLEVSGVLSRILTVLGPVARPFGLTGLAMLSMLQITFVSFVAPLPTLTLMEDQGTSDRHLAAAFAAILAMAPANATFPLAAFGLKPWPVLALSLLGGIASASITYWLFARRLSSAAHAITVVEKAAEERPSLLKAINLGGLEAIQIVINIIPMLLLSLAVVVGLERIGLVETAAHILSPMLQRIGVDEAFILPTLTKYFAGSTAVLGIVSEMIKQGRFNSILLNQGAGFLLHPLDLPGVAILLSAGPRLARTFVPALAGAVIGILLRATLGALIV